MASWILAKFIFECLHYAPRRSRGTQKTTKIERGKYPAVLIETSLVNKGSLFPCETQWEIPNGQDSAILPTQVANHSRGFVSSCLLTELAI